MEVSWSKRITAACNVHTGQGMMREAVDINRIDDGRIPGTSRTYQKKFTLASGSQPAWVCFA